MKVIGEIIRDIEQNKKVYDKSLMDDVTLEWYRQYVEKDGQDDGLHHRVLVLGIASKKKSDEPNTYIVFKASDWELHKTGFKFKDYVHKSFSKDIDGVMVVIFEKSRIWKNKMWFKRTERYAVEWDRMNDLLNFIKV